MYRRSRLDLYFDVLQVIHDGTHKPTPIMYKASMAWKTLQEIFVTLRDRGFIRVETNGNVRRYFLTEKGERVLTYHHKVMEVAFELMI